MRPPGGGADPGAGHLRHLVQLRPVAVLHPGLARRHGGLPPVLPRHGHGDGLRHHLLLGRQDDDARSPHDRCAAVRDRLPVGPHPRPVRREDVEDEGQHGRPARDDRRARRRRPPVRARPRDDARPGPAVRRRPRSRTPATSPTSCGTPRATSSGHGRRRSPRTPSGGCPTPRTSAPPTTGSCPASRRRPPPWTRRWPTSPSARSPGCCTTRSGTSTATGAWSWPRSASRTSRCRPPIARRPGGRWSRRSTRTCACSIRSCRSSPRRCGTRSRTARRIRAC